MIDILIRKRHAQIGMPRKQRINVWSAGCATGEEAYSLAACLLDLVPKHVEVSILATDLLERNLAAAREGVYGAWSRRPSGPMLHPIFEEEKASTPKMRIAPRVRALVHFSQHNLLEAQKSGPFDLILCRNVLVYFSPESVRAAVGHLVSALDPEGALRRTCWRTDPAPGMTAGSTTRTIRATAAPNLSLR